MIDTLYISDIPADYKYVQFSNDYYTLWNRPQGQNTTLTGYRVFYKLSQDTYTTVTQTFGNNPTYFQEYAVSNSFWYSRDLDKILICVFILVVFFIFIQRIMLSIFKRRRYYLMNFFNFFKYIRLTNAITYFFKNLKRNFVVVAIILAIIVLLTQNSHAQFIQGSTSDQNLGAIAYYENINVDFVNRLQNSGPSSKTIAETIRTVLKNSYYGYYLYYETSDGSQMVAPDDVIYGVDNLNELYCAIYALHVPHSSSTHSKQIYMGFGNIFVDEIANSDILAIYKLSSNFITSIVKPSRGYIFIPNMFFGYRSNVINNWTFESVEKKLDIIDTTLQNQTNTITDSNVEDSSITVVQDNTDDITSDFFNSIFTRFQTTMTSTSASDVVVPIPFTNTSITLSANYVRNIFNSSSFSAILTIINAYWYYIVGRFIVKDVEKYIHKIKDGSIATSSETNIKTEML